MNKNGKSYLEARKASAMRTVEASLATLEDGIVKARRIIAAGGNEPIFTTFLQAAPFLSEAAGKHEALLEAIAVLDSLEKKS